MKFIKPIIYILVAFVVVTGIYFAYDKYTQISKQPIDALYIIPNNAAIAFATSDYSDLRQELNAAYKIWDIIEIDDNISLLFSEMDSLWKTTDKYTNSSKNRQTPKVYYSIHYDGKDNFTKLLSFSFKTIIPNNNLENIIKQIGEYSFVEFEGYNIYKIKYLGLNNNYFLTNIYGNICISKQESLIRKVITEKKNTSDIKQRETKRLIKIADKGASSNIYVNHTYFYKLLSSITESKYSNTIKQLKGITQFSVLDGHVNSSNIIFNGYSYSVDSIPSRLSTYSNYKAPKVNIFEHIPANTNFIYYQGAEGFNDFISKQITTPFNVQDIATIKKYEADVMTNISKFFYPWMKSELALCYINNNTEKNTQSIVLMNSYDLKESKHSLGKLQSIMCNYNNIILETDTYRTYVINEIPLPYLLPKIFGNTFNSLINSFYIITNEYVVFANSKASIKSYINNILVQKTLAKREGFEKFRESINNEASIMLYANAHSINSFTNKYWNKESLNYFKKSQFDPQKFGDICLQFIVNNDGAFTSINISTNDIKEETDNTSWQLALDFNIKAGPFVIKNHITNENNILIFDERNTMYRINNSGKIEWAIPVPETPIGKPEIVDYFNNGKYQFLYNSNNNIYMYDINGNSVDNYPIELSSEATAALSLINYDNSINYRILIPQIDGAIHNYQIDGSATKGWQMPQLPTLVITPVQHFNINNKDFILLCDSMGNVVFSNRRGIARIETKLAFTNNINTKFYTYNNNLITTDIAGRLISIDNNGKITKTLFRDFSKNHRFYLCDINGDNKEELIYYDKNTMYAFDNNSKLLWTKKLDFDLIVEPLAIGRLLKDSTSIIIYNENDNYFEFGNENGTFTPHEEFLGSKYYILYKASKNTEAHLISVKERIVSNYMLN
ncbi:MAG: hypothetical protein KAG84_03770 [Bacteroidales bacterium]|nr:hypothetical protein [Bacteroidales bacterium]